jgi:hypothetical protein
MAFQLIDDPFPGIAASVIQDRQVVALDTGATERSMVPMSGGTSMPFGIEVRGATALQGEGVAIADRGNYAKAIAAASLGAGADIAVVGATRSLGLAAGASGLAKWTVGQSVTAAAAGEVFTLYVNPRQLSGLS